MAEPFSHREILFVLFNPKYSMTNSCLYPFIRLNFLRLFGKYRPVCPMRYTISVWQMVGKEGKFAILGKFCGKLLKNDNVF